MLCIDNKCTDAYFNIASEEYLLKNFDENIFMLYQDEPSIIIGKHQNIYAEANIDFANTNNMKVVRRYSGGGTVFHDMGNLNLTFIETGTNLNFDKFTNQMLDILSGLGINAVSDKRRAINVDGFKISGSAQCIHKNRVMYHATLLFSSDLKKLSASLEINPEIENKEPANKRLNIKSVRSPVTNITEYLKETIDIGDFKQFIFDHFKRKYGNSITTYTFTKNDINNIKNLMINKYATTEWNYHAQLISS